ncbi:MAG: ABC-ATPase domain-containing protein [Magnetococcales bacterium]|nr:ABC-ATPase domain-containing protein [Magnetococcales bacterium]
MEQLQEKLLGVHGRGYRGYKILRGRYVLDGFHLQVDWVQGDPYAEPSPMRLLVAPDRAAIPASLRNNRIRTTALEDYLARQMERAIVHLVKGSRGSGHSGKVRIRTNGQAVLRRSALLVHEDGTVEARLRVGLPAAGRRPLVDEAREMLCEELPALVDKALIYAHLDADDVTEHVNRIEDQAWLREWLHKEGLVAFVANGAILPRRSGVDDRPMEHGAHPFSAPKSLLRTPTLPHAGPTPGMAIPQGVTLIVGGGFHGKSTLLQALERGVYNHRPGDGRERVVTDPSAVKICAEDGRAVHGVELRPFINHLPGGKPTHHFTTENASGSTSQAANIMEALASGSRLLLMDEDTSATNFMIRDSGMRALVSPDREPITPLSDRIRRLYEEAGVSTILVMGGSSAFFSAADHVVMMDNYRPEDVTTRAIELAAGLEMSNKEEMEAWHGSFADAYRDGFGRRLIPETLIPIGRSGRPGKIAWRTPKRLQFGELELDLSRVEQLVDPGQGLAMGYLLRACGLLESPLELTPERALSKVLDRMERDGFDAIRGEPSGELALPRLQELTAAFNRMRVSAVKSI